MRIYFFILVFNLLKIIKNGKNSKNDKIVLILTKIEL